MILADSLKLGYYDIMKKAWTVRITNQVHKIIASVKNPFPLVVKSLYLALIKDLKYGLDPEKWKHHGKIKGPDYWHYHLKRGKPTYVARWKHYEGQNQLIIIEVFCVGTHENAPYQK